MRTWMSVGVAAMLLAGTVMAAGDRALPSRMSMNVTTPRQTQGATFGEKRGTGIQTAGSAVAQGAMTIEIGCTPEACLVAFPDGQGFRVDLAALGIAPLDAAGRQALQHWDDPHESLGKGAAASVGGAVPGAGILSVAVSAVGSHASAGGASAAGYAAAGRAAALPSRSTSPGSIDITQPLADGEYQLTVVVEKPVSGLKDTLKTQVRQAAPAQKVQIVIGFSAESGALKPRHDTVKNSISNMR